MTAPLTIVRAIDSNGDWTFGMGRGNYLSGQAALAQQIRCNILLFLNDCFWSMSSGIDWFNLLGTKEELLLQLNLSATILNTPGVTGLLQVSVELTGKRALNISYAAQTVYSKITNSIFFQMAA